jgi:predicted 3-demethylubiquinone-9 3-methyltransferase (glyoxalase superfamily)
MFASFRLGDVDFMAADSSYPHGFTFNEGISFYAYCESQGEIDFFWTRLTDGGEEQQCGWAKDRYGVSWQIVPKDIEKLADSADPVRAGRVNAALMKMKKIDLDALRAAYNGIV